MPVAAGVMAIPTVRVALMTLRSLLALALAVATPLAFLSAALAAAFALLTIAAVLRVLLMSVFLLASLCLAFFAFLRLCGGHRCGCGIFP